MDLMKVIDPAKNADHPIDRPNSGMLCSAVGNDESFNYELEDRFRKYLLFDNEKKKKKIELN